MTWTRFMDMHSGGGRKGPAEKIIIEAPEDEARVVFYNRFGLSPDRVTCTCCGEDYSVTEGDTLEQITAYDRNCHSAYFYTDTGEVVPDSTTGRYRQVGAYNHKTQQWEHEGRGVEHRYVEQGDSSGHRRYLTLEEHLATDRVLVVRADEILPEERVGSVPQSGYVWVD